MFGILDSLAGFIKIRYVADKPIIDSTIARLHYRVTAVVLFVGCLLCTANSLIGNPIECIHSDERMQKVLNQYCWISSTFTLPAARGQVGVHVAHAGVGAYAHHGRYAPHPHVTGATGEERYHAYYQWVPFVLFFQGLLFYAPHWFWKNWEDGKIRLLSDGIRGTLAETREGRKERQSKLVQYVIDTMDMHNWYALGYYVSEILNFVNVIGNIYFTDKFLGGKFLSYGIVALKPVADNETSPFVEIFPRVTKCTFHKFGHSGTIEVIDTMCVLALNILNEKIYIFLWWWFIFLAVISGLALFYSSSIIVSPAIRRNILCRRFKFKVIEGAKAIVNNTKVGDFFLLHLLGQNINMVVYTEFLEELSIKLGGYAPNAPNSATIERQPIYPTKQSLLPE
ncbi:hypothetical protein R5R35_004187 [Gryllus longicercus]|uniref:Innexin n=1 Tax=Gryllus longicercus TaxID=2509291 RepID=A0AAN9Z4I3_9ORTH